MEFYTSFTTALSEYVCHIVGWQCRVLVKVTTLRGLDNCAQIWGMDGPYCDAKYVSDKEKIRFYERNSMLSFILRGRRFIPTVYSEGEAHSLLSFVLTKLITKVK